MTDKNHPQRNTRSFIATLAAVAWSFIGLRRNKDFDEDAEGLNPLYVIIGGLIAAGLFIGLLITIGLLPVPWTRP